MSRKFRYITKWFSLSLAVICLSGAGWYALCSKPELFPDKTHSRVFYDRTGKLLRLSLSYDQQYRVWTELDSIPEDLKKATLLYEDQYFYRHNGINPVALMRAVYSSYLSNGRRMGASTITMQLARLRFGLKTTDLSGKFKQIRLAVQLERHYSKDQILEAYLNLAPYGHNIQGVGAASVIYFHKPVEQLSFTESALLAVIPQNPNKRKPSQPAGYAAAHAARERLLDQWQLKYGLDAKERNKLVLQHDIRHPKDLPFHVPHVLDTLSARLPVNADLVQHTSLDLSLHQQVQQMLSQYITARQSFGLHNAASMILDTRSMQILSEVGSADYFNSEIHGQVNGTQALRSPGSTLKPFIYALAIEQGLIHPLSILKDAPKRFGAYTPENSDQQFAGPLSATAALVRSRNIPAVDLLQKLEAPSFHQWLSQTDLQQLFSEEHYGLALALGGNEVTMQELVELYASLANLGVHQNASYSVDGDSARQQRKKVLSPEAALLTVKMLSANPHSGANGALQALRRSSGIADSSQRRIPWKTGTSYAYRDAWAVGLVGHYAVAVWLGNFDGTGNPALTGRKAAAPLFFQIANLLQNQEPNMRPQWLAAEHGLNIRKVPVCKSSGGLNLEHCPDPVQGWFIPGVSPIKEQGIYREVLIDKATGLRACDHDPQTTEKRVFTFWPSDIETVVKRAGLLTEQVPTYLPSCEPFSLQSGSSDLLQITSPMPQLDYVLQLDKQEERQIPLTARAHTDAQQLHWFVNKEFVGSSSPEQALLWQAELGEFEVTVIDDLGRSDNVQLSTSLVN